MIAAIRTSQKPHPNSIACENDKKYVVARVTYENLFRSRHVISPPPPPPPLPNVGSGGWLRDETEERLHRRLFLQWTLLETQFNLCWVDLETENMDR